MSLFGATPQPAQSTTPMFSFGGTTGGSAGAGSGLAGSSSLTGPVGGQGAAGAGAGQANTLTPSFSFSLPGGNTSTPQQQAQQQQPSPSLFGQQTQQAPFGGGFGSASQSGGGGGGGLFSSPFAAPQQGQVGPQQNTPSQFSSSFGGPRPGGGLTHSQSAFDLSGSMMQQQQQQQQPPSLPGQFIAQQQQGQQQNQIMSTNAFLLTSPPRAPPPAPAWAAGAGESRRYVPSHLTHMRYKNSPVGSGGSTNAANGFYTPDRMPTSPIAGTPSPGGLGSMSRPARPFPASQSTTALRSSAEPATRVRGGGASNKFAGPSFGVPKPHHTRSSLAQSSSANVSFGEFDDLPPTESIYDAGAASPFAFQLPTTSGATGAMMTESSAGFGLVSTPSSNAGGGQVDDSRYMQQPGAQGSTPGTPALSTMSPAKEQATSVIVFGFPPELTHVVVDHFARFGTIMEHLSSGSLSSTGEHHVGVSDGTPVETGKNWVKITYTTAVAANRALAENGRTLGSMDYVIGCVPHSPTTPAFFTDGRKTSTTGLLRGSGPSLNIHALLSEGPTGEDLAGSSNSRRRKGDELWKAAAATASGSSSSNLFTPVAQPAARGPSTPQQQVQEPTKSSSSTLPRMSSVPAGLGKRIDVHGPEGIFKEKERKGGMLSGSATLRGLASIFLGGEQPKQQGGGALKRLAGDEFLAGGNGKRPLQQQQQQQPLLPQQQESWLGWTTKKTQEFIFGWDDL
ncbi:Nup53/35/40-type RNA recognition motif-domain-containing protein [Lipomyces kononenkoae]